MFSLYNTSFSAPYQPVCHLFKAFTVLIVWYICCTLSNSQEFFKADIFNIKPLAKEKQRVGIYNLQCYHSFYGGCVLSVCGIRNIETHKLG
jgi:hypothetical protein